MKRLVIQLHDSETGAVTTLHDAEPGEFTWQESANGTIILRAGPARAAFDGAALLSQLAKRQGEDG